MRERETQKLPETRRRIDSDRERESERASVECTIINSKISFPAHEVTPTRFPIERNTHNNWTSTESDVP